MGTLDQFYIDIFSELLKAKERQLRMEGLTGEKLREVLSIYEEELVKEYM